MQSNLSGCMQGGSSMLSEIFVGERVEGKIPPERLSPEPLGLCTRGS